MIHIKYKGEKEMKKILLIFSILFLTLGLVGCSCSNDVASDAVEDYLNDYKSLSEKVLKDLNDLVSKEDLNDKQKEVYKEVVKRQYRDLNYTIENEDYDGDTASVTVKITVYDLYKSEKEASDYLNDKPDEFLTDGVYDNSKYLDYKLDLMHKAKDTITYNIVIKTTKIDGKWQVEQPNDEVLEKIHGIYNYDEDNSLE